MNKLLEYFLYLVTKAFKQVRATSLQSNSTVISSHIFIETIWLKNIYIYILFTLEKNVAKMSLTQVNFFMGVLALSLICFLFIPFHAKMFRDLMMYHYLVNLNVL